jgi:carboxyl-terminal processing protease
MVRGVVPIQSLLGYRRRSEETWDYQPVASDPIAYIRISAFRTSTLQELRQAARIIESPEIRGLVIDLRNNPGGELQQAVLLADELLEEAPLGRLRDARGELREFRSGPDSRFAGRPMIVLVNAQTASAAEFLAAALQYNDRAVIVGEPTAGACYVKEVLELPDGLGSIVLRCGTLGDPTVVRSCGSTPRFMSRAWRIPLLLRRRTKGASNPIMS